MTTDQSPVPARRFGAPPVEPSEPADVEGDDERRPALAPTAPAPADSRRREWWNRLRRPWIAGPLVVVVAFGVWWFAIRSSGDDSTSVATTTTHQLVTVTRGNLTNTVSAEGTVAAAQTDDLSFTAAGTVTAVNVAAGQQVKAGDVLAAMNSPSLQSAVSSAASTLAKAQATLSDDEASGASSDQITADQTSVQTATDSLARAWQGLAGAQLVATFDGTVSSVNLTVGEQLSSSGSGGTTPTGSGSGSGNSSSSLGSGSNNGAGGGGNGSGSGSGSSTAQISVVSAGSYTVSLPVSSSDVDGIKAGDPVTLSVTTSSSGGFGGFGGGGFARFFGGGGFNRAGAGGGTGNGGNGNGGNGAGNGTNANGTGNSTGATPATTVTGAVTTVGKVASATSGVAQYPITVAFTTDNTGISIGTTVSGAISTSVVNDVLQIPLRAVTTTNGKSTVEVALDGKTNGRTETRTVQIGRTAGGSVEITSGLKEGDQVIVTTVVPKAVAQNGTNGSFTGRNGFGGNGTNGGRGFFGGGGGTGGTGTGGTGAKTGG